MTLTGIKLSYTDDPEHPWIATALVGDSVTNADMARSAGMPVHGHGATVVDAIAQMEAFATQVGYTLPWRR